MIANLESAVAYVGIGGAFLTAVKMRRVGMMLGQASFVLVAIVLGLQALISFSDALRGAPIVQHYTVAMLIVRGVNSLLAVVAWTVVGVHVVNMRHWPKDRTEAVFTKLRESMDALRAYDAGPAAR